MPYRQNREAMRLGFDLCESRICLSSVAFVAHDIECCAAREESFSLETADVDGDGDLDVVAVSQYDRIAWYENSDGKGTFESLQVITLDELDEPWSVAVADLDGDGDVDVVSGSDEDGTIAWFENTDGRGTFGSRQVIANQAYGAGDAHTADMDGDGDTDVVAVSYYALPLPDIGWEFTIDWYENTDGDGTFGRQHAIVTEPRGSFNIGAVADVDGDGDLDVLSTSGLHYFEGTVAWHENTDGRGTFGPQRVIITGSFCRGRVVADVDGDSDPDLLASCDGELAWYENTDGRGTFGLREMIDMGIPPRDLETLTIADIDSDGDLDVLSASWPYNIIAWNLNTDGNGTFGPLQSIAAGDRLFSLAGAADLDGDGDVDVLSTFVDEDAPTMIKWHEQRLVGDTNDDGIFNSDDLLRVLQAGKYEDGTPDNATFDEGDWNGDGDFDTGDLVLAFQAGHYAAADLLDARV